MTERDRVRTLVDEVVAKAQIPSRRERDDLRRELLSHFEDCGGSQEAVDAAIARFGAPSEVAARLHRVYRFSYLAAYGFKLAAAVTLSGVVACLIEVGIDLLDHSGRLSRSSELARPVILAGAMVLSLLAASEALHRPLSRLRISTGAAAYVAIAGCTIWWMPAAGRPMVTALVLTLIFVGRTVLPRTLQPIAACLAFAGAEYGLHAMLGVALGPVRALTAGAVLLAIAASTASILGGADRTFARFTGVTEG